MTTTIQLRPYQIDAVADAVAFVADAAAAARTGRSPAAGLRKLYSAPMGTGKSVIMREIQQQLANPPYNKDVVICTPSAGIIRGILKQAGYTDGQLAKEQDFWDTALHREGLWTPIRLRNAVLAGDVRIPDVIIVDEAHHHIEDNTVAGDIMALCRHTTMLGFTATAYRGTPMGSQALLKDWGRPHTIIGLRDAVAGGYMRCPEFNINPLLDDDEVTLSNGEFKVASVATAMSSRIDALAEFVCQFASPGGDEARMFDRPTMVALPATEVVRQLAEAIERRGVKPVAITQDTGFAERQTAFAACQNRSAVLLQIGVVGEGIDLPWLRRLIDAKPTMSPTAWFQLVGRITRPNDEPEPPEYICTNRNLERHAYLWDGLVPPSHVGVAQDAFGGPSQRAAARHMGLEALARFKPLRVPGLNVKATLYYLYAKDSQGDPGSIDADMAAGATLAESLTTSLVGYSEWAILVVPGLADPVAAKRSTGVTQDGIPFYGSWVKADMPTDLRGFATSQRRNGLSEKQKAWWQRSAAHYGLDPNAEVSSRIFSVLPLLKELKVRLP